MLSTLSIICRRISIKLSWINQKKINFQFESQRIYLSRICKNHLHKSFAEEVIMIHEKIAFKNKQSVESKSSNRSMRKIRRESVIFTKKIKDEFSAASTSYHIQNLNQLKYWLKKNEAFIVTTWTNMRNEHVAFFNQLNKKMNEMNDLTKNYNTQANKIHDAILIIRELRMKQREINVEATNSNTLYLSSKIK